MSTFAKPEIERNLGAQPLDSMMNKHGLTNNDVCNAVSEGEQMTHKAVQRARKGRRLTPHMQKRITETVNAALKAKGVEQSYVQRELFTY